MTCPWNGAAKRKTNHDHQRQLPHCNYAASATTATYCKRAACRTEQKTEPHRYTRCASPLGP
ncbi:hypothetical protein M5D96_005542, partial [Drosophila gunungcola]